jgi:DNA-binding SARP family transcriptional activator
MRLYFKSGDRAAAARQYERCAEVLRNELRIEPDDETKALYRAIRSGHRLPPALPAESESAPMTLRPRRPKI